MANGGAVDHAVDMIRRSKKTFGNALGLHLNLTEGYPLCDPSSVSSLLTREACPRREFRGKTAFWNAEALDTAHVVLEVREQIRWFRKTFGRVPIWVDGHQHCHVAPHVCEAIARTFSEEGVKFTRVPVEEEKEVRFCEVCKMVSTYARKARCVYEAYGIRSTDCFVGLSFCGTTYSLDDLVRAIRCQMKVDDDDDDRLSCEVMTHPGGDIDKDARARHDKVWDTFDTSPSRQAERRVLCDPRLPALVHKTTQCTLSALPTIA